ncbi:cysteine sulfinic acid decarboxylase [Planococcus citri]|uniref:cysteine sulfinic acid decarboxylase n=1 Tax=Planococcus citri TaxID=170843 RepID=UPI0031F94503
MPIAADITLNSILDSDKPNIIESKSRFLLDLCGFESAPSKMQHDKFFRECVDIVLEEAVFKGNDRKNRVTTWKSPEDLQKVIDFTLRNAPSTHEILLQFIRNVIKYSVKTGHPYFMNQLFSSVDPYGLVGQWLVDALNCSVYTFEVAPVFTLMEEYVLDKIRNLIGFDEGDGIFSPGGSIANGYAINCARFYKFPEIKENGLHGLPRLVLFTSNDAHYSIKKLAAFEGLGSNNVYLIKTDSKGKMDPEDLEKRIKEAIAENAVPFMVSATSGTTVLGAYDPLSEIADLCDKYKIWLHVDGAWGGAVMFSARHRHLIKGIERADSVTFNPHKMLTAPQQCSTFITKHKDILNSCHSCSAQYLFQKDKFYDTRYDTGDKHIQCGRRADVMKFWLMWKAKGSSGFENHINRVFDLSQYFIKQIQNRPDFQLVLNEPECTNICFWYIPKSLQNQENTSDYRTRLHAVAAKIKEKMMIEGTMMITYQPLNDLPNFFRLVIQNSSLNYNDMDHIISEFERLGKDL